jgi:predicted ATPase
MSGMGRATSRPSRRARRPALRRSLPTSWRVCVSEWLRETLRIRGELRLEQGDRQLAEADFQESISMARSMWAKAWELRTTTSLAQLLAQQGRRDEARKMLAEVYNWFTEGFDTADLSDAKALLDELSG